MAVKITTEARRHGENHSGTTAKELDLIESGDQIEVTIYVRPNPEAKEIVSAEELGAQLPKERHYLSREELELICFEYVAG